ncbi:hypothetical protein WOLCODRAFT_140766 [Wolfiporia cocos MD-104 SS10]|uniref:Uncharacterized protein n=1 Tax=Wolfiporia cocos (strain MD-104) TaxID=742152 RepID=A0A2H3J6E3_WOLCO|nr:hypothetical protein WOLCODRAFT_140766 [Wolfiporia cocos MD-104 SS10]
MDLGIMSSVQVRLESLNLIAEVIGWLSRPPCAVAGREEISDWVQQLEHLKNRYGSLRSKEPRLGPFDELHFHHNYVSLRDDAYARMAPSNGTVPGTPTQSPPIRATTSGSIATASLKAQAVASSKRKAPSEDEAETPPKRQRTVYPTTYPKGLKGCLWCLIKGEKCDLKGKPSCENCRGSRMICRWGAWDRNLLLLDASLPRGCGIDKIRQRADDLDKAGVPFPPNMDDPAPSPNVTAPTPSSSRRQLFRPSLSDEEEGDENDADEDDDDDPESEARSSAAAGPNSFAAGTGAPESSEDELAMAACSDHPKSAANHSFGRPTLVLGGAVPRPSRRLPTPAPASFFRTAASSERTGTSTHEARPPSTPRIATLDPGPSRAPEPSFRHPTQAPRRVPSRSSHASSDRHRPGPATSVPASSAPAAPPPATASAANISAPVRPLAPAVAHAQPPAVPDFPELLPVPPPQNNAAPGALVHYNMEGVVITAEEAGSLMGLRIEERALLQRIADDQAALDRVRTRRCEILDVARARAPHQA